MKIEKAQQILKDFYAIAMSCDCINDKVAWALHKTWELAEIDRRKREAKQNGNNTD